MEICAFYIMVAYGKVELKKNASSSIKTFCRGGPWSFFTIRLRQSKKEQSAVTSLRFPRHFISYFLDDRTTDKSLFCNGHGALSQLRFHYFECGNLKRHCMPSYKQQHNFQEYLKNF